jgi:hypothetical protein
MTVATLAVAFLLVARLAWEHRGGEHVPPVVGVASSGVLSVQRAARLDMRLWELQPSAADPMGPTTEGWLALLEGES